MTTSKKPKWKLSEKEFTNIVLPNFAKYHLVVTDQMFQRVAKFAKNYDGVSYYIGEIIEKGAAALNKITQDNYNWKVFQHLQPETDDENKSEIVMTKHNSKTKVRKHEKHHMLIRLDYSVFYTLKKNHARINTFSMALLARGIIEIFLSIYEECGDYDEALKQLGKVILALCYPEDCEKSQACFKIFMEVDENDSDNKRLVVFFIVNVESEKLGISYHLKLRL